MAPGLQITNEFNGTRNYLNDYRLPLSVIQTFCKVQKSPPNELYESLTIFGGAYRVYCITEDGECHILGLNDDRQLVLLDKKSHKSGNFIFRFSPESFNSRVFVFVDESPISYDIDGECIKCFPSGSAFEWALGKRLFYSFSDQKISFNRCDFISDDYDEDGAVRQWGVGENKVVELKKRDDCHILPLFFKLNYIPLATRTYNIYCSDNSMRKYPFALDHNGSLVVLPYNAPRSRYAKFTFTVETQDDRGTFMKIYANGLPIVRVGDLVKCFPSAQDEAYAWEVFPKDNDVYYILQNGCLESGIRRCWVGQAHASSDDLILVRLKDFEQEHVTFPPLLYIVASVN